MLNESLDQTYEWEILRLPDVVIIYCNEDDPSRVMSSCYVNLGELTYMQRM
jgi:hypothetical protein